MTTTRGLAWGFGLLAVAVAGYELSQSPGRASPVAIQSAVASIDTTTGGADSGSVSDRTSITETIRPTTAASTTSATTSTTTTAGPDSPETPAAAGSAPTTNTKRSTSSTAAPATNAKPSTSSTLAPTTTVTVTEAPTSASSSATERQCDPNYSGCVPIASDVDCAGGSGNGPAYVQGPVQVIGRDIYGLDRDNDGVGCEDG